MKSLLIFVTMGLTLLCSHANAACAPPDMRTNQGVATALVKLGYLQSGTIQPVTLTSAVQTFQTQSGIASDGVVGPQTRSALTIAFCGSSPAPAPAPAACLPSDTKCTLTAVIGAKGHLIASLEQALNTQAAIINPSTGESWDPYLVTCLSGTPGQGTAGESGYIAPAPGLIAWIQGLEQEQPGLSSVPPLPSNPTLATVAEHARLLVIAAQSDIATLADSINTGGFPQSVRKACSAFVQDALVTQPAKVAGQVTVINTLLLKFLPK